MLRRLGLLVLATAALVVAPGAATSARTRPSAASAARAASVSPTAAAAKLSKPQRRALKGAQAAYGVFGLTALAYVFHPSPETYGLAARGVKGVVDAAVALKNVGLPKLARRYLGRAVGGARFLLTVHRFYTALARYWKAFVRAERHRHHLPPPTDPQVQAIVQFIQNFAADAAFASGARTREQAERFVRAHKTDIEAAAKLNGEFRKVNRNGAYLIARGVRNRRLRNAIVQNYRYGAKVGDGSTAAKLLQEAAAGCARGGCRHFKKAVQYRTNIQRILSQERLSTAEREVAGKLVGDLNRAIAGAGGR